jgi:hypothetical protein
MFHFAAAALLVRGWWWLMAGSSSSSRSETKYPAPCRQKGLHGVPAAERVPGRARTSAISQWPQAQAAQQYAPRGRRSRGARLRHGGVQVCRGELLADFRGGFPQIGNNTLNSPNITE